MNSQKIRFVFTGILNTFFGYLIFTVLTINNPGEFNFNMFLTILSSSILAFYLHRQITFKSKSNKWFVFILINVFVYFLNVLNKNLIFDFFENELLVGILVILISMPVSYILNKKLVFNEE